MQGEELEAHRLGISLSAFRRAKVSPLSVGYDTREAALSPLSQSSDDSLREYTKPTPPVITPRTMGVGVLRRIEDYQTHRRNIETKDAIRKLQQLR